MALSIKTEKADRLVRELVGITGETITRAVEAALEERLAREETQRGDFMRRVREAQSFYRANYDLSRPITKAEWDNAGSDD